MRVFFSEYPADYVHYNFPYQVYGIREANDELEDIYDSGFLPTRIHKDLFYLCRSLRISLSDFELSSENRRILKKVDYLDHTVSKLNSFKYEPGIGKMAVDFAKERFEEGKLSSPAVRRLFTESSMTDVTEYSDRKKVIGYALMIDDGKNIRHYAYPFYDLSYYNRNIGMGMMLKMVVEAKKKGYSYIYLGTCYTKASKYKLQFSGLEYYTGMGWSDDMDQLSTMLDEPPQDHLFKLIEDKASFIEQIRHGD